MTSVSGMEDFQSDLKRGERKVELEPPMLNAVSCASTPHQNIEVQKKQKTVIR